MSENKKKYPEFQKLIKTMDADGFDYRRGYKIALANYNKRKSGYVYSLSEHIEALVFAQLSSQRPWKRIGDHRADIKKIFLDFNAERLENADVGKIKKQLLDKRLGNRQIKGQLKNLKYNIGVLKTIAHNFDNLQADVEPDVLIKIIHELSYGQKHKLKYVGVALAAEYLRNIGFDLPKPDTHVTRILYRLGYADREKTSGIKAIKICMDIAKEYNMLNIEVDSVLWQYCADGNTCGCTLEKTDECGFNKCTATPHCNDKPKCKAYPCKNCPNK